MKILSCLVAAVAATTLVATSSTASAAVPSAAAVHVEKDKPDKSQGEKPSKNKNKNKDKEEGSGANGDSNTANGNRGNGKGGNGRNSANQHASKGTNGNGAASANRADAGERGGPSERSRNENRKITFCHVPPGNPDNGHLITTSVNAITPGHSNHPGDIIPPFSFVKHGETVVFAGQNWDAEGRAMLDSGCRSDAPAEDQRITFCHVPPGNLSAAHLITTAPEALSGHVNHGADLIPPVTYEKAGETVTFAGQNWDAAGQALLDRGCLSVADAGAPGTVDPTEIEPASASGAVKGTFAKRSVDREVADDNMFDGILPQTGGARLALLLLGVGLVAAGAYLVSRRRGLR